jgi:ABC-type branched-subunit amino acid transport system substrate-binding protein
MWNAAGKWAFVCLVLVALAGCTTSPPAIKIGLVAPFEGRHRSIGYDAVYSARMAIREINAAGGIGGRPVALVALDDRGELELARQTAATLAVDPAVMVVVGHFLPETTAAASNVYSGRGLSLVPVGSSPFGESTPEELPTAFRDAYAVITPFDEVAGPFAGPTYDAFGLIQRALAVAKESEPGITRETVQDALLGLEYEGITGKVFLP